MTDPRKTWRGGGTEMGNLSRKVGVARSEINITFCRMFAFDMRTYSQNPAQSDNAT